MHVQIINFELDGMSEDEYVALCEQLAPAFAAVPGLRSKVWLADSDAGVFGGVYMWESIEAMQAFAGSELFAGVANHPHLASITSKDFATLNSPTALTSNLRPVAA